jgi:hypothetical protein
MRGITAILIVFLSVLVVLLVYIFFWRPFYTNQIKTHEAKHVQLSADVDALQRKQLELPRLLEKKPVWRQQLIMFKSAIPAKIEDEKFFGSLAGQLEMRNVKLQTIEVKPIGPMLKDASEATLKALKEAGIDTETAKMIQVAYYSIQLEGDFGQILNAFESLKGSGRLYTVDEITAPATGGGGAVTEVIDPAQSPIKLTGAIYYGIPESYLAADSLSSIFGNALIKPFSRELFTGITKKALDINSPSAGKPAAKPSAKAGSAAGKVANPGAKAQAKPKSKKEKGSMTSVGWTAPAAGGAA